MGAIFEQLNAKVALRIVIYNELTKKKVFEKCWEHNVNVYQTFLEFKQA